MPDKRNAPRKQPPKAVKKRSVPPIEVEVLNPCPLSDAALDALAVVLLAIADADAQGEKDE